jgi:hypothetical protein
MAYHFPDPPPDETMPIYTGAEYVRERLGGGNDYLVLLAHSPVTGQCLLSIRGRRGWLCWMPEGVLRSLYRHRPGGYHRGGYLR